MPAVGYGVTEGGEKEGRREEGRRAGRWRKGWIVRMDRRI
jgi:hypothetical protein